MKNTKLIVFLLIFTIKLQAQPVEVLADYNAVGDCIFGAYNNGPVPMYLQINFADLQNTTFNEPLPYVKKLSPGFNDLFILQRDPSADVPRFNYEIKVFRSDPNAKVDLKFPYLIPFEAGTESSVFDVKNVDGFWGSGGLGSWTATGFNAKAGAVVFAARTGVVVEIEGKERSGNSQNWYHTWTRSLTLLQPDGTLICYRNIEVPQAKLKPGQTVYAGQAIGKIAAGADELVLLIFHDSLYTKNLLFVLPEFVTGENEQGILSSTRSYTVVHPREVRALEMNRKEQRRILGK